MRVQNQFWLLNKPNTARGLAEWDERRQPSELLLCNAMPEQHRFARYADQLNVLLTSRKITDFIWTWYSELLIQDKVLNMFREQGFTGFDVKPVTARMKVRAKEPDPCDDNLGLYAADVKKIEIPTLWEVVVTGWAGIAPPESGVRLIECCPGCNRQVYSGYDDASRLVDSKQWDGSDFFMVWPLPRYIFVTDRVVAFIKKQKLTGVRMVSVENVEWSRGVPQTLAPGRLREWMPDERARELGEPLGIY